MYKDIPVDRARKYFLLVMCDQSEPEVARSYLREKVEMLWRQKTAREVYAYLDLHRQKQFDALAWADGFHK